MQHLQQSDADLKRGVFSFLALENVVNLAVRARGAVRPNLEEVTCILESVGWAVIVWHVLPRDWGVPFSRPRLWISVVPRLAIEWAGYEDVDSYRRDMHDLMDRLVGFEEPPLDQDLLPEDSPFAQEVFAECNVETHLRRGDVEAAILPSGSIIPQSVRVRGGDQCKQKESPKWMKRHEK